jgi:hypothetical protein
MLFGIFSGILYVNLQKYFSHPSLVIYFFATPPIKLKLGQQIGGGLLIANHLDQSLEWADKKTLSSSQIIFITLFSAGGQCRCALHQTVQLC